MVQRGGDARLVEEHVHELVVRRVLGKDALEHDVLLEAVDARGAREVDLRHPAARDSVHDLVLADARTGRHQPAGAAETIRAVETSLIRPGPSRKFCTGPDHNRPIPVAS